MGKGLMVTAPVFAALFLVVVVEGAVTHAIVSPASPLTHAVIALTHVSAIAWLVWRFAVTKRLARP